MPLFTERTAKPLMMLAMAMFGTIGMMTRYIDMPAVVIVLFRGVVGTLFLLLVILVSRMGMDRDGIHSNMFMLMLSGICLALNWIFLFEAYKTTDVSLATLCNYLTPAFVILVSPLFLRDRFTPVKLVIVAIAVIGLALTSGVLQEGMVGSSDLLGISEGVLAAVFYTGMIICNKKLGDVGPFDRTLMQLFFATVVVIVYCMVTIDFTSLEFDTLSIILAVVMGVVQTGITFTLYFGTLRYLEAGNAAVYGYLEPIVSLLLSALILGEVLGPIGWIGAAMVLGSTLVYELFGRRLEDRVETA